MSVLGGISQFFGPLIGAISIILIEDIVGAYTEYWSLIIGAIIMAMVIVFPKGIVGEVMEKMPRFRNAEKEEI
jgi:branched-chain amino acid transport system permease protein